MATRSFHLSAIGEVTLNKRRGAKNIRLSLAHDGAVRLTIPAWMPYRAGLKFVEQKQDWIKTNRRLPQVLLPQMRVGKAHRLIYRYSRTSQNPSVRVSDNQVVVSLPRSAVFNDKAAQSAALRGCIKALKQESQALLPQRLDSLAKMHGFSYRSVQIKQLKSRWGSCNQDHDIALNCYLIQLPWHLIDYVLLHELTHTRILAHGKPFWQELSKYVSDLSSVRRTMRQQRPHFHAEQTPATMA